MAERSYTAGRFAFGIDGEFAGFIRKCSGGVTKGELVTHKLGPSNFERKHLATISHEPLTIEISMGMGLPLWRWIKDSWGRTFRQKTCELLTCDFNHKVMAVRVFEEAYIKKVTVPSLDGSNKDPGYFTVELDPVAIRYEPGKGTIEGNEKVGSKKWLCSNFRLDIDGLPCKRVAKIDSFTWEQKIVPDEIGDEREYQKEPSSLTIPNLKLTISMADYEPWYAWFRSFVIDGKCTNSDEKTGTLVFLGPDLQEELGTITFMNLGLISMEQEAMEANADKIARFVVELYCESMFFDVFNN